jgi:hypothetical protein
MGFFAYQIGTRGFRALISTRPALCFRQNMKAVAANRNTPGHRTDFYISTLAPVNHQQDTHFRAADAVMLIVLFLEMAVFMRLYLAN